MSLLYEQSRHDLKVKFLETTGFHSKRKELQTLAISLDTRRFEKHFSYYQCYCSDVSGLEEMNVHSHVC